MNTNRVLSVLIAIAVTIGGVAVMSPRIAARVPGPPALVPIIPQSGLPASGCWIQIWEDENFQDDNDIIVGPGRWNNMRNLPGANKNDWGDEIDSLKTGPNVASVRVWEDENFDDNSRTFGPNESVNNLCGSPDLGDTVDSLEIVCR